MTVVDAHHHLWRPARGYSWLDDPALAGIRRDFQPADLLAAIAGTGVRRTVLVEGGRCDPAEAAEFLGYAAATDAIAGVVAWADVADPDLAAVVGRYRALPGGDALVGLRSQLQGEPDPGYLDRPQVLAGLATVAAAGLTFDLVVRADQLAAAARAAAAVPQARLVLDHLGKPRIGAGPAAFAAWRDDLARLAANPGVSAKLSGLVTEAGPGWTVDDLRPYAAYALEVFGPRRLMFGSDWPVCLLVADYAGVLAAARDALPALGDDDRAEVFGGTAVRVYGLGGQPGGEHRAQP